MSSNNTKKYNAMEPVLNYINREYVSLSQEDKKRNNIILQEILKLITSKMEENNELFKEMYTRVFFGGSYYDGLKVGNPNEYDLDLLLKLPKLIDPTVISSDRPGFIHLQLKWKEICNLLKHDEMRIRCRDLDTLLNEDLLLDTSKVLGWIESVVTQAFNEFPNNDGQYALDTDIGVFHVKISKGGPAFTLHVNGEFEKNIIDIDIDLVPCFYFGKDEWPIEGFRPNPIQSKPDFFIVPKPLPNVPNSGHYWRLSFQEQEKELMEGKRSLKPTVRLLKRLRDNEGHKYIASYFLKTIVLWQVIERDEDFWNNSLSYVFMAMLKEYKNCLVERRIPYFWNEDNDLIKNLKEDTKSNLCNRIKSIIEDIEEHISTDPTVVAKYLLNKEELHKMRESYEN